MQNQQLVCISPNFLLYEAFFERSELQRNVLYFTKHLLAAEKKRQLLNALGGTVEFELQLVRTGQLPYFKVKINLGIFYGEN